MSSTKDHVMTMLATLSSRELKDVRTAMESLEDVKASEVTPDLGYQAVFYKMLCEQISRATAAPVGMPFNIFLKNSNQYPIYAEQYDIIYGMFCDNFHGGSKHSLHVAMSSFFSLVVSLIIEDLHRLEIPVSLKPCVNRMRVVPGLIDRAFPGYIQAGLLSRIL